VVSPSDAQFRHECKAITPPGIDGIPPGVVVGEQGTSWRIASKGGTGPGCASGAAIRADGQCPTGDYTPADPPEIEDKTKNWGDKARGPGLVDDLNNNGTPAPHDPPWLEGPPTVHGGRETTQNPDGSTTTKDKDHIIDYEPPGSSTPGYKWKDVVTTKYWPPGVTPTEPGGTGGTPGGTTTSPGAGGNVEIKTCGLPGTPPCKIDESGTPAPPTQNPQGDAAGAISSWKTCLLAPTTCFPALPSLNWGFTFPSSCAPIPTPAFAPFLTQVDVCQFQPIIHDLLSMVWAACGLFAAVGMVGRDARGGA
jgi:hypothetical protein